MAPPATADAVTRREERPPPEPAPVARPPEPVSAPSIETELRPAFDRHSVAEGARDASSPGRSAPSIDRRPERPGSALAASPGNGADTPRGPSAGPAQGSQGSASTGSGGVAIARGGTGDGPGGLPPEYDAYLQRFRRRVQESLAYPLGARRRGISGQIELDVLLEPSGRVASVRVLSSSSHAVLDDAAVEAVKDVKPEPLPADLPQRPLRIRLPLGFQLE